MIVNKIASTAKRIKLPLSLKLVNSKYFPVPKIKYQLREIKEIVLSVSAYIIIPFFGIKIQNLTEKCIENIF